MDKQFLDFIYLYAVAVNGSVDCPYNKPDYEKIIAFASNQGVLSVVMPLLKKYQDIAKNDSFGALYNEYLVAAVNNEVKTQKIMGIVKKINDSGIKCCLLKGSSLAVLYKNPETRISGDIDILIDEKDEIKALSILEKEGFTINHRTQASNHSVCVHEQLGCIELHVKLYYDFMEDIWFDNIVGIEEQYLENDGIYTLGYTDGYLYVLLHAIKHFISGGLSVRHFSDVLLYAEKYADKIDFDRTNKIIKRLKYDRFEEFIYFVGDKYFDIRNIKAFRTFSEETEEEIFGDMLKGGIFGKNEKERARFFEIYNERRFNVFKNEGFGKYMTSWRRDNAKKVISFSKHNIVKRYPYAAKGLFYYFLALFAHMVYLVKTAFKRRKVVKDVISYRAPEVNDNAQKRLELLEKMNMI